MGEVSEQTKNKVAAEFFDSGLLQFGEFRLKSGLTSPFYVDLRKAQSHPEAFHAVTAAYMDMIEDADESLLLAGVPEAATPLAAAVGYELKRTLVQPRKEVKDHGTKSSIEGDFQAGDKVILLDDLITKGDSKLEAIKQIEAAGLEIDRFIVLVDREQGGLEVVEKAGYEIEAAFTITEIMDSLLEIGKINHQQHKQVLEFVAKS